MTNAHNNIDQTTIVTWLEAKKYDLVLTKFQHFIQRKVADYIQGFKYYHQFEDDFYHDVYLHLRTQSLPSKAFLEACRTQNMFTFYLAKCIRNRLNTLLSKERQKHGHTTALENLLGSNEDLQNIETDRCFGKLRSKDLKTLMALLNGPQYRQQKDLALIQKLAPYFKKYRKEKGEPKALQRWINQYIAGDKYTEGIIDRLTISDANYDFKIQSKRWFLDFVYEHFQNLEEGKLPEASVIPIYYKRAAKLNQQSSLKFQQG